MLDLTMRDRYDEDGLLLNLGLHRNDLRPLFVLLFLLPRPFLSPHSPSP